LIEPPGARRGVGRRRRARRRLLGTLLACAALLVAGLALVRLVPAGPDGNARPASSPGAASPNLVTNPGFERDAEGWQARGGTILGTATPGRNGQVAARVEPNFIASVGGAPGRPRRRHPAIVTDAGGRTTAPDAAIEASAWVRTTTPPVTAVLRLSERTGLGDPVGSRGVRQRLTDTGWHRLQVAYTARRGGSLIGLEVGGLGLSEGQALLVDQVQASRSP
jgi:hypothetical protein